MADTASPSLPGSSSTTTTTTTTDLPGRGAKLSIPPSVIAMAAPSTPSRLRGQFGQFGLASPSPVNQNGSFEFDRVLKAGYVQRRTQKTKTWKTVYLVLRPNALSIYKSDKENKLRHKLDLTELSAVTLLKDPKQKRHNLFGLFSPAKNFHFEASSAEEAQSWVELIRKDARIEEEEEEMFLASPIIRRQSFSPTGMLVANNNNNNNNNTASRDVAAGSRERLGSASSPEPEPKPIRRTSNNIHSENEHVSHSDFSDGEHIGASIESLAGRSSSSAVYLGAENKSRPTLGNRNLSQMSGINIENDPDRVVWQGWLFFLKSKRGVKQWKKCWAVLRPRNLILYKNESEYTAAFIMALSAIVNVVDIDPLSKTKTHCMQVITDEKSYRFCALDEESLVHCLGAFKSLLSKRREMEARQPPAAAAAAAPASSGAQ